MGVEKECRGRGAVASAERARAPLPAPWRGCVRAARAAPEAAAVRKAALLAALRRRRITSTPRQHKKAASSASAAMNPMPSGVPVLMTALTLARAPPGSAGGSSVGKSARGVGVAPALRVPTMVLEAVAEAALLLLALPEGEGELVGALSALAVSGDAELSGVATVVAEAAAVAVAAVVPESETERVCRGAEGVGMEVRLTGSSSGGGLESLADWVASATEKVEVVEAVAEAVVQGVGEAVALGTGVASDSCCDALALGDGVADDGADTVTAALGVAVRQGAAAPLMVCAESAEAEGLSWVE